MSNKDLDFLIKRIGAATGDTQEGIAKRIKYSRAHFSVMKKSNKNELYDLIEAEYSNELNGTVVKQGDKDLVIANLTEAIKRLTKSTEEVAANNTKMVDYLLSKLINSETSDSASQPAPLKGAGSSIPIDPVKKKLSGKRGLPSGVEQKQVQKGKT